MFRSTEQKPAAVSATDLFSPVYGYLPEAGLTERKQAWDCRLFREDCALVRAAEDFRILASRTSGAAGGLAVGKSLLTLLERDPESCRRLRAFGGGEGKALLLLPYGEGCLLFFSQLRASVGLLLVLHLEAPYRRTESILSRWEGAARSQRIKSNESGMQETARYERESPLARHLADLLWHTERMLSPRSDDSLRMLCRRAAGFAGCRILPADHPSAHASLSPNDHCILVAALIGCFLILRGRIGRLETDSPASRPMSSFLNDGGTAPEFLLRILQAASLMGESHPIGKTDRVLPLSDLPQEWHALFSLPALRRIRLSRQGASLVLELTFPFGASYLRAGHAPTATPIRIAISR